MSTVPPLFKFLTLILNTLPANTEVVAITLNTLPDVRLVAEIDATFPTVILLARIANEAVAVEPGFVSTSMNAPVGEVIPIPRRVPAVTSPLAVIFVVTWTPFVVFKLPEKELEPVVRVELKIPAVSMLFVAWIPFVVVSEPLNELEPVFVV